MMQENKSSKKLNVKALVGIFTGVIVVFLIQHFFFNPPSFDEILKENANAINKKCPIMVDQETRLDNTMVVPDSTFQYNYTLINLIKDSVDVDAIKRYVDPLVINNVKTNPDMKIFRSNKVTLNYNYKDKNGELLFNILVSPDKYSD